MARNELGELHLSNEELAWMAGILEGEGSCSVYATHDESHYGRVYIANTEKDFLEPFQIFGGKIILRHRAEKNWKPIWAWAIYGMNAYNFLVLILPFIRTARKKEIAWLVLNFLEKQISWKSYGRQGRPAWQKIWQRGMCNKLKTLCRVGPPPRPSLPRGQRCFSPTVQTSASKLGHVRSKYGLRSGLSSQIPTHKWQGPAPDWRCHE